MILGGSCGLHALARLLHAPATLHALTPIGAYGGLGTGAETRWASWTIARRLSITRRTAAKMERWAGVGRVVWRLVEGPVVSLVEVVLLRILVHLDEALQRADSMAYCAFNV